MCQSAQPLVSFRFLTLLRDGRCMALGRYFHIVSILVPEHQGGPSISAAVVIYLGEGLHRRHD
jgi:hypothetical protein